MKSPLFSKRKSPTLSRPPLKTAHSTSTVLKGHAKATLDHKNSKSSLRRLLQHDEFLRDSSVSQGKESSEDEDEVEYKTHGGNKGLREVESIGSEESSGGVPARKYLLSNLLYNSWFWEKIGMLLSVGIMAAIVGVLLKYDNHPLRNWPYHITINTLISFLNPWPKEQCCSSARKLSAS